MPNPLTNVSKKSLMVNLTKKMNFEFLKQKNDNLLLRLCNAVYKQNTIEKRTKRCIFTLPKKCNIEIINNYGVITLTAEAANIYNAPLLISNTKS